MPNSQPSNRKKPLKVIWEFDSSIASNEGIIQAFRVILDEQPGNQSQEKPGKKLSEEGVLRASLFTRWLNCRLELG